MAEKEVDKRNRIIKEHIPYQGLRAMVGTRMKESLTVAPQGSMMTRADMSHIIAFREKLKAEGHKVSYTDIFMKLVAHAIKRVPIINATLDERSKEIIVYETVNAGLAVRVHGGVVAPVIADVEKKSLLQIAEESRDYLKKAQEMRFDQIPLGNATITINNLGVFKIDGATPFLNLPEATMFCLGAIRDTPWVDEEGKIVVRPVITLVGTNDHRVNDGADLAEFLDEMVNLMRDPEQYCM